MAKAYKNICSVSIALLLLPLFIISSAYSQSQASIEKATREVDRFSSDQEMQKKLKKPMAPLTPIKEKEPAPPKKEGQKFFLKKVTLNGTESLKPEAFEPVIKKYRGKEITLDDVNEMATEIKKGYLKKGIIAACFVPPQDVKEGVVILQIVEAKMGELKIEGQKRWYLNKERIASYWTIEPGEVLNYDEMSRALYLINENPDRKGRATLYAGQKPGTTDVLLNVDTKFPVHLTGSFDREGAVSTGRERKGIGVKDNNFLLVDDTFVGGYTYGTHFEGIYVYHKIPITGVGTSFMYGYSSSESHPGADFDRFGIDARSRTADLLVYQDLYDHAEYMGETYGGLSLLDKSVKTNTSGTTNRDRLRVLRLGGDYVFRSPISVVTITPEVNQGINGLGSTSKTSLSSREAENTFSKFTFSARHSMLWPLDLQSNFSFRSQIASERLMPQEEMDLGGINSVRGYPWGDYQADNGIQLNAELVIPAFFIPRDIQVPYVFSQPLREYFSEVIFIDYGYGEKRGLRQSEKDNDQLVGIGAGIRVRLGNQGSLRLEWGFPVGNKPITEGTDSKGRFHFSIDFEDRIPEEIARIKKQLAEDNKKELSWTLIDEELNKPGSPLRARIEQYRSEARAAFKAGDFDKARDCNVKIYNLSLALQKQIDEYMQSISKKNEGLRKENAVAQEYYAKGDYVKAKEIWVKIVGDARPDPLVLNF